MFFDSAKRVKTIGLVIPDSQNLFYQQLSHTISKCLFEEGYMVLQCNVAEDLQRCYHDLECLTSKNVDGIIVIPPCIHSKNDKLIKMLKSLQDSGVPMILVDRAVYSVFCDFVTADNKQGGKIATEYLLSKGHRKIGCIMADQEVYTVRKRLEGYTQALAINGIPFDEGLTHFGRYDIDTGIQGAEALTNIDTVWLGETTAQEFMDNVAAIFEAEFAKGLVAKVEEPKR